LIPFFLSSIQSLWNKFNQQQTFVNNISRNVNDSQNIIKFKFEEAIIVFINWLKNDNNFYFTDFEQNINGIINSINLELENHLKDKSDNMNKLLNIVETNKNHHTIMVSKFIETL
jgi:hypothetical protein